MKRSYPNKASHHAWNFRTDPLHGDRRCGTRLDAMEPMGRGTERSNGSFSIPGAEKGVSLRGFVSRRDRGPWNWRAWCDGAKRVSREIGIDPASGTILRLVLEADPDLGSSMERADIIVEYGSVVIGYTCPVRSVSISTGRPPQVWTSVSGPRCERLRGWPMSFSAATMCSVRRFGFCPTEIERSVAPNSHPGRRLRDRNPDRT